MALVVVKLSLSHVWFYILFLLAGFGFCWTKILHFPVASRSSCRWPSLWIWKWRILKVKTFTQVVWKPVLGVSLPDARWFLGVWRPEQAQEIPGRERIVSVHPNVTKFKGADGSVGIQFELKSCWNAPKSAHRAREETWEGLVPQQHLHRLDKWLNKW